jgi:hypothetical protein
VLLYAVTTGHGSDDNNCGEFCVTSHVWTINGRLWNLTFAVRLRVSTIESGRDARWTYERQRGGVWTEQHAWPLLSFALSRDRSPRSCARLQEAGTEWGCTLAVPRGSIPNEHGTWHLGRDGWCDGQNVRPWVVDVTDALFPAGAAADSVNNTLWYAGYFQGHTPAPQVRMVSVDDRGHAYGAATFSYPTRLALPPRGIPCQAGGALIILASYLSFWG